MCLDEIKACKPEDIRWVNLACPICDSSDFKLLFKKSEEPFVRCKSCSLVMINPRPVYDNIIETYDEKYSQGYAEKKAKKLKRIRPWVKKVKKTIPAGRWLDVGCSACFVVLAAHEAGFEAFGVDVESWGVEYGKAELGLKNLSQGALEEQNYPDNFFNVISMYDVIEHVPDLNSYVSELKRILAPNGILDIRTPDVEHWKVPKDLKSWEAVIPSEHLYNFSYKTLAQLLNNHDFKITQKRFNLKPGLKVYVTHK